MSIAIGILIWLFQSVLILLVFGVGFFRVADRLTRNKWTKLSCLIVFGLFAGGFMAWLGYVPFTLFFVWITFTKDYLALRSSKASQCRMARVNKIMLSVTVYAYAVTACASAWYFQSTIRGRSISDAANEAFWLDGIIMGLWGIAIFFLGLVACIWHLMRDALTQRTRR